MKTTEDLPAVAGDSADPAAWLEEFEEAFARVMGRFARVEPRPPAKALLLATVR